MSSEPPVWARTATTTALVLLASYTFFSHAFFYFNRQAPYVTIALACGTIVLFRVQPSRRNALLVFLISAVVAIIDVGVLGFETRPPIAFSLVALSYIGAASYLVLGIHAAWAEGEQRRILTSTVVPMLLFVLMLIPFGAAFNLLEYLRPKSLDLYLNSFDASLGIQASFMAGVFLNKWNILDKATLLFYVGLPIPLAIVFAGNMARNRKMALTSALAFLLTGPIGLFFYNMMPALGPVHIFGPQFPYQPMSMADSARIALEPIVIKGARNAMPSLHMAWALLGWWNARRLSWVERSIVLAFVIFTVLATLGTGEHYLIDLAVAYPFALMIQALASFTLPLRDPRRIAPMLAGLGVTMAWLGLLSYVPKLFWISPVVPWSMMVATVAATVFMERRLDKDRVAETALATPINEPLAAIS